MDSRISSQLDSDENKESLSSPTRLDGELFASYEVHDLTRDTIQTSPPSSPSSSNSPYPLPSPRTFHFPPFPYLQKDEEISKLRDDVAKRDREIAELRDDTARKSQIISELRGDMAKKDQTLEDAKVQDIYQGKEVARLHAQVEEQTRELQQAQSQVEELKMALKMVCQVTETVHESTSSLKDLVNAQLAGLETQVSEK